MFLIMHIATWRKAAAVLTTLALASTSAGCSSGGRSPAGTTGSGSEADGQSVIRSSGLTSALGLIPDIHDGHVMYTDWSMLSHQDRNGPGTASFAGALLAVDAVLQRDLGIRSTDAQWELDVQWPSGAPLVVLGFGADTDLSALAGKLPSLGFHADGALFTGTRDTLRRFEYELFNVAIDPGRNLLAESADTSALRSVLTAPAHPFARATEIVPLLSLASARLGGIATASIAVGPAACMKLTSMFPRITRAELAYERQFFHGTFTAPQAEITALPAPAATTALDALTFPDQQTAQANRASRSAASKVASGMFGGSTGIRVTGAAVTGRVLSFDMTATQPRDFPETVDQGVLGVDICP